MNARRASLTWVIAVGALALAMAVGWWAARATLPATQAPTATADEPVWAEVVHAKVGRSLSYSTTLRQPSLPVAYNGLAGVVTKVGQSDVAVGAMLYRVGHTSVRAVQADEPMWRDLQRGDSGDDVLALQGMLRTLGHYAGEPSGSFDAVTERAVAAWQKSEGRAVTGLVQRGELIAFPKLPAQASVGSEIAVGRVLAGGEEAVRAPTGAREFILVLSEEQATQVPIEATVEVMYDTHTWSAVITETRETENLAREFVLAAPDGGEVCGDACEILPLDDSLTLRSRVIVVPEVSGPSVPTAAIRTSGDGVSYVESASGKVPVEVVGSGQGLSVVSGIATGDRVLVGQPASASPTPAPSDEESEG